MTLSIMSFLTKDDYYSNRHCEERSSLYNKRQVLRFDADCFGTNQITKPANLAMTLSIMPFFMKDVIALNPGTTIASPRQMEVFMSCLNALLRNLFSVWKQELSFHCSLTGCLHLPLKNFLQMQG